MKSLSQLFTLAFLCALPAVELNAQAVDLSQYITEDFVAGFTASPARFLKSSRITTLIDATGQSDKLDEQMLDVKTNIGIDPREAEQLIMLLDRRTIFNMAGLPEEPGDQAAKVRQVVNQQTQRNNLKQIALAFHNFHDVYQHFVDDDGHQQKGKGNLSWRVHLLPFLDEAALYQEFNFEESWDSKNNKALIPRMPQVFLSNGIEEKGKTCVHVLTSDGALFDGNVAPRMRDITDGTSNTLLTVVSGAEKASIWTKPGGLELKKGAPIKTLGDFGDTLFVGVADGSVRILPGDLAATTFQALATRAGGEVIGDLTAGNGQKSGRLPSWIVRSKHDIDREAVLASLQPMGKPVDIQVPGGTLKTFGEYAISFPDSKTLVAAPADLLPKMLKNPSKTDTRFSTRLSEVANVNDLTFVADFTQLKPLKDELAGNIPMAGILQAVEEVQASFDVAGTGKFLQNITATMQNEVSATQLSGLLMGAMHMQRAQMMNLGNMPQSPVDAATLKSLVEIFDSTEIKADGVKVSYGIPKPDDMDAFVNQLRPIVKQLSSAVTQARGAARQTTRRNSMKMIGLAFHNYHDVYRAFPRHSGNAEGANKNLSWRVELLPFVEHAELYNRFKRDEPWDSDHNKALISEMPDVYKTKGIEKPGHTAVHVFIGDKTPFGDDDKKTRIRNFTDGTSNTILAVEAGPDTADIWTKPGGLKFTGDNGLKVLGTIGDTFNVLLTDGSVRAVSQSINKDVLHNLIQHQDGNVVGEY